MPFTFAASDETDNPFVWKDVTSDELFAGKRNVLFGVPGAFTPTCNGTHVPEYKKLYDDIRGQNVDEVYCISVNDGFVMRQWGLSLGLEEEKVDNSNPLNPGNFKTVKLIPDGAAQFTEGMGMDCVWDTERGFEKQTDGTHLKHLEAGAGNGVDKLLDAQTRATLESNGEPVPIGLPRGDEQFQNVKIDNLCTIGQLRQLVRIVTGVPVKDMKLICKGAVLKTDTQLIKSSKIVNGSKIIVMSGGK
eukprot:gene32381-39972_t